jgi:DNA-binding transcriptional ArsR family regulator
VRVTPRPVGPPSGTRIARTPALPATDAGCEEVASRFRALSEPTRLKILRRLARSEASVGEILAEVGGTQANVSRHLAVLFGSALVDRRKDGPRTLYRIADPSLLAICTTVCEGVERQARDRASAILGPEIRKP